MRPDLALPAVKLWNYLDHFVVTGFCGFLVPAQRVAMESRSIVIRKLPSDAPELPVCARWRYDAFLSDGEISFEESLSQLTALADGTGFEVVLLAEQDGVAAGMCLVVRNELDAAHDLSPWLASVFVLPEFRRRAIGRALVRAAEDHARRHGIKRLHLYTDAAEGFYARCGWRVSARFDWYGEDFTLMLRDL